MNTRRNTLRFALLVAPLALALSACTSGLTANVKRFESQLPAPDGQTFAVVADDPALAGGLEFSQYARLVEARMASLGYTPARPENANLLVRFDYGVDKGRERVRQTGFAGDPFWGPWYGYGRGGFYGRPYRSFGYRPYGPDQPRVTP